MSGALSPSTHKAYGVARLTRIWQWPRSSFQAARKRSTQACQPPQRRGPKTPCSDEALTAQIRQQIGASPFHGEGHRKIWARLRHQGVRTSKDRVLRLMRQAQLLAPARCPRPQPGAAHNGTILSECPNQLWGTDATATGAEGQVTIFAALDG